MKKIKGIIIVIVVFIIDLISKLLVTNNLKLYGSYTVIEDFFNITYTKNKGAAFGILNGNKFLIIIISLGILIYLINEFRKKNNTILEDSGISLIIGGLISNLSDRIFLGYVRDFLDFKIFNYNFAIFNIGDIAIVVGCIVYFIGMILEDKHDNKSKRN